MKASLSHWGLSIKASVRELWSILGAPEYENNEGEPTHSNYLWHGILMGEETDEQAYLFDIYDHEPTEKLLRDEQVEWRINTDGAFSGLRVKDYLIEKLLKLRK